MLTRKDRQRFERMTLQHFISVR